MTDRYRDRPFPTDDGNRGYSNAPQGSESDPLAELARLIGQTDPFSNFSRDRAQHDRDHDYDAPARDYDSRNNGYSRNDHGEQDDDAPVSTPPWVQRQAGAASGFNGSGSNGSGINGRGYNGRDRDADRLNAPSFDDGYQSRGDVRMPVPPNAARRGGPVDDNRYDDNRYDDLLYGEERRPEPRLGLDTRFEERPFANDFDQEAEAPAPQRRGGLATVIVVLALAILGTAGAYAYRSFTGSPRSGEPPVFKADAGPNKIVPPSQSGDKQSYDRVGDKSAERVVSREEQPMDIDSAAKNSPRVVFPPLAPNPNPPTSATVTTTRQAGAGTGTLNGEEPRKIKTLTIRPDQPDAASAPSVASNAPLATAPVRQITTPPRTAAPANTAASIPSAPTSNGPMSLTPQAQSQAAPPSRVASINPSAQASTGGGSFVQVSSQKTEADAQASYRALQAKYSGILGSRTSSIKRADLGDKGVFYRAMVGPFASTDEATQFCVNLKSAGGQCIVQRN